MLSGVALITPVFACVLEGVWPDANLTLAVAEWLPRGALGHYAAVSAAVSAANHNATLLGVQTVIDADPGARSANGVSELSLTGDISRLCGSRTCAHVVVDNRGRLLEADVFIDATLPPSPALSAATLHTLGHALGLGHDDAYGLMGHGYEGALQLGAAATACLRERYPPMVGQDDVIVRPGPDGGPRGDGLWRVDLMVENAGARELSAVELGVYVSPDPDVTTADVRVDTRRLTLRPGQVVHHAVDLVLPEWVAGRRWWVGVVVEPGGAVEWNTENNRAVLGRTGG